MKKKVKTKNWIEISKSEKYKNHSLHIQLDKVGFRHYKIIITDEDAIELSNALNTEIIELKETKYH